MSSVTKLGAHKVIQIGTETINSAFGVGDLLLHNQVGDRTKIWGRYIITSIDFKQTYDKRRGLEGSFIYTCLGCDDASPSQIQVKFTQTDLYDRINIDYSVIPYYTEILDKVIEPIKNIYINLQNDEKLNGG